MLEPSEKLDFSQYSKGICGAGVKFHFLDCDMTVVGDPKSFANTAVGAMP